MTEKGTGGLRGIDNVVDLLERCKSCWRNLTPGCTDVVKNDRAELTFLQRKENPGLLLSLLPSRYVELLWAPGAGVAHATHLAIGQQQLCSLLELTPILVLTV